MKLMYLMTEPMGIGGVQSDMLALSKDLTPRGHDVYVATQEGELLDELTGNGAKFVDINFHFKGPIGFLRGALALQKAIKKHEIEVLAPQSVRTSMISYFALRVLPFFYKVAKTQKRIKIITTIHNIHNPAHFKYGGKILRTCADYVIFESHYERNRLLASGLQENCSSVIHSGIDTDKFKPLAPDPELLNKYGLDRDKHIIYGIVARLSEEKGHQYLLEAFKKVQQQHESARLLIIGSGPLEQEIKAKCTELELDDVVIFTGVQRNIAEHLSILDVFTLSSTRESFPLAAREAMAAGKAVIAPRIGGCPEVVDEGKTGYLFEAGNSDDLADKMLAISEKKIAEQFGLASRQRVIDLFSRIQWMDGDEAIYLQYGLEQSTPLKKQPAG